SCGTWKMGSKSPLGRARIDRFRCQVMVGGQSVPLRITLSVYGMSKSSRKIQNLIAHSWFTDSAALSRDGRSGITSASDGTTSSWDLEHPRATPSKPGHLETIQAIAASSDGRIAISASSDRTLKVWDLNDGTELRTIIGHDSMVFGVALSGDGRRAVSGSWD